MTIMKNQCLMLFYKNFVNGVRLDNKYGAHEELILCILESSIMQLDLIEAMKAGINSITSVFYDSEVVSEEFTTHSQNILLELYKVI